VNGQLVAAMQQGAAAGGGRGDPGEEGQNPFGGDQDMLDISGLNGPGADNPTWFIGLLGNGSWNFDNV
jgi:hypothetical protein